MYRWAIMCGCLLLLSVGLIVRLMWLKREIRQIQTELKNTRDKTYNRQITVSLFDKDLSSLAMELNKNLDYQKKLKLETEQAERSIKQSVSDIAHDLRTPLTVIKGNLQMLQKEEKLSEKGLSYLNICSRKADAMKLMADDFFELSLLESDHGTVELSKINATKVIMQFLADNEAVIRENNLTPDIRFPEKSVFIMADEQFLVRMLHNLLNNIIKYAEDDSFQIILEESQNHQCKITFVNAVSSQNRLETGQLFERTYRGDQARRGEGAGLGLYIVKLLAQKQGARVKAERKEDKLYLSVIFRGNAE